MGSVKGLIRKVYSMRRIFNRPASSTPQQPRINPEAGSGDKETKSKPGYPPVWVRIPAALILGLGSNGVMAMGLLNLDKRKHLGSALFITAIVMTLSSLFLCMSLGYPATWGWRI
jgi:hypothetical protein